MTQERDSTRGWYWTTSGQQQQQLEQKMIKNGTINLEKIIFRAIESKINTHALDDRYYWLTLDSIG